MTEERFLEILSRIPNRKKEKEYEIIKNSNNSLTDAEKEVLLSTRQYLQSNTKILSDYKVLARNIAPIYARFGNKTTPLLIRQVSYYIIYVSYVLVDINSQRKIGVLRPKYGWGKKWIYELNTALEEVGYTKYISKGLFNNDKWAMPILNDYCNDVLKISLKDIVSVSTTTRKQIVSNYTPPALCFDYAGHKDGYLGYLLNHLVQNVDYRHYVELYGGSGVGLMQHPYLSWTTECINDLDKRNVCFYNVLANRYDEFIKACNTLVADINCQRDPDIRADGKLEYTARMCRLLITSKSSNKGIDTKKMTLQDIKEVIAKKLSDGSVPSKDLKQYNLLKNSSNKDKVAYALGVWNDLHNYAPKTNIKDKDEIKIAIRFFFIHYFLFNGKNESITGVQENNLLNFLALDFDKEFRPYHDRMKDVQILKPADANKYISEYDSAETLIYSDSPYISTSGYQGLPKFTLKNMQELIDNLVNSKSKWIFSCKNGVSALYSGLDYMDAYRYDDILNDLSLDLAYRLKDYYILNRKTAIWNRYVDEDDSECQDFIMAASGLEISQKDLVNQVKVRASRYEIIETFKMFKPVADKIFVYFAGFSNTTIEEDLKSSVVGNDGLEIMISNIDCEVPDYNLYLKSHYNRGKKPFDTYKKIPFSQFYRYVRDACE